MKILLIGGSKSGKSMMAQELCRSLSGGKDMIYWATMEPCDSEDLRHIEIHRSEREGWGFETLECAKNLDAARFSANATILFDSATALLTNEMFGKEMDPNAAEKSAGELLRLGDRCKNIVTVADEIFRDGKQYDEWTERFQKGLAAICRTLAADYDVVIEVIAGVPHYLKGAPI